MFCELVPIPNEVNRADLEVKLSCAWIVPTESNPKNSRG